MRNIQETGTGVIVDNVPIQVMTNDLYQRNKSVAGHVVVVLDGFLRIRRAGGGAMMQIPVTATSGVTEASVRSSMTRWFTDNDGHITNDEYLENAVRAAARGYAGPA